MTPPARLVQPITASTLARAWRLMKPASDRPALSLEEVARRLLVDSHALDVALWHSLGRPK